MTVPVSVEESRRWWTEERLRQEIAAEVESRGGVVAWVRDSRGEAYEGAPDVLALVPGLVTEPAVVRFLWLELKQQEGRIRASQKPWLALMRRPDWRILAGVVRPLAVGTTLGYGEVEAFIRGDADH